VIVVEWEDSAFDLDDEDVEVYLVKTMGVAIRDKGSSIAVAGEELIDQYGNTHYRAITVIPRRSIVNIHEVPDAKV